MATTSLWRVRGQIGKVLLYVENPDKTMAPTSSELTKDQLSALSDVIAYAARESATIQSQLVSGINCSPQNARNEMLNVKRKFEKESGTMAYHGYQSFSEGEVSPELAHQIGVRLATELWGDRYQILVATHTDKDTHIHNHFVINTVSFVDGIKFHRTEQDYQQMVEKSDALCKEYGLSVLPPSSKKGKTYSEWSAEKNGKPTFRSITKDDIDRAVKASTTMRDFMRVMEEMGYTMKVYKKNGERLAHPVAVPPGAVNGVRLDGLGYDYTIDGITRRILRNVRKQVPFPEAKRHTWGTYRCRGSFKQRRKVSGIRALYFYYCYQLKTIQSKPASVRKVPVSLREDLIKMDQRIEEMKFLGKNKIETGTQLVDRRIYAEQKITELADRRADLRNALKRVSRLGDTEEIAAVKAQIADVSAEIKQHAREVKLCNSIAERSGIIKENLDQIIQQKINERKENNRYEPSKRRSGTDRQNVPWGH